jgi:hypothetical protein
VLWGTLLLDYDNEEEARLSLSPRGCCEILGVSDWDGQGRSYRYPNGFLLVTHTGGTFYFSAFSKEDRDEWVVHVKRALECNFANPDVISFKPSKHLQRYPPSSTSRVCFKTKQVIPTGSGVHCKSCGNVFSSSEFVQETSTILQLGMEEAEKVCSNCKLTQACVLWIRSLNYVHVMNIHEFSPGVSKDIVRYKATFKLRRRLSTSMEMAAALLEQKDIDLNDYEELRQVDHDYRWNKDYEESTKLKAALDTIGHDMHMIVGMLTNPNSTESRMAYFQVILRLLEIADEEPQLIDFYLPQLLQAHLVECGNRTVFSLIKLDILQQALLVLSQKYPPIGLKMTWILISTIQDYTEKRVSQVQYAASVCLLVQLEMAMTGTISLIADVPGSHVLSSILCAASHQQNELASDVVTLFLVRRKLQEDYDEESAKRLQRYANLSGTMLPSLTPVVATKAPLSSSSSSATTSSSSSSSIGSSNGEAGPITAASATSKTCFEMLHDLGVGQARPRMNSNDSDVDDVTETDTGTDGDGIEKALFSIGYSEQLDFVERLCNLAESLRFIARETRNATLKTELTKWNDAPSTLGWDPTTMAGEPVYRVERILVDDCRVFRTKARAPSLVVCIVRRQDVGADAGKTPILSPSSVYGGTINASSDGEASMGKSRIRKKTGSISEPVSGRHQALGQIVEVDDLVDSQMSKTISDMQFQAARDANGSLSESPTVTPPTKKFHSLDDSSIKSDRKSSTPQSATVVRKSWQHHHMHDFNPQAFTVTKKTIESLTNSDDSSINRRTSKVPSPDGVLGQIGTAADHGVQQIEAMFKKIHLKKSPSASSLLDLASAGNDLSPSPAVTSGLRSDSPSVTPSGPGPFPKQERRYSTGMASMQSLGSGVAAVTGTLGNVASFAAHQAMMSAKESVHAIAVGSGLAHGSSSPAIDVTESSKSDPGSRVIEKRPATSRLSARQKTTGITHIISTGVDDVINAARAQHSPLPQVAKPSGRTFSGSPAVGPGSRRVSTPDLDHGRAHELANEAHRVKTSAQKLLQSGMISQAEYDQLVSGDGRYRGESARIDAEVVNTRVCSAYGEPWLVKKRRVLGDRYDANGELGCWPAWDLRSFIVKSNDDLRQEVCCVQLMELCREIFDDFGLSSQLWLKPYRIVSSGSNTGIVQVLTDAMSLDALKKTPGFGDLNSYFISTYSASPEALIGARQNFTASLAAYSLFAYILAIKDRHNGNILLDTHGHILHIDFGFMLSIAPGGSFSLETAPFKLTEEMVDVLGGLEAPLFNDFVKAFTAGFLALRANAEPIIASLQILATQSPFPCFQGKDATAVIDKLRGRFRLDLQVKDVVQHCLELVIQSYGNYGTKQYDNFQRYSNGIYQ